MAKKRGMNERIQKQAFSTKISKEITKVILMLPFQREYIASRCSFVIQMTALIKAATDIRTTNSTKIT